MRTLGARQCEVEMLAMGRGTAEQRAAAKVFLASLGKAEVKFLATVLPYDSNVDDANWWFAYEVRAELRRRRIH